MIIPKFNYISPKRMEQLKRNHGSQEYQDWRKKVLERDNHCCQFEHNGIKCGQKKKLQIHHIKRFEKDIHLRTAVYNGITLCDKCHRSIYAKEGLYELTFLRIVTENERKQRDSNPDSTGHEGTRPPPVQ